MTFSGRLFKYSVTQLEKSDVVINTPLFVPVMAHTNFCISGLPTLHSYFFA